MIRPATLADAAPIAAICNARVRDSVGMFNSVEYTADQIACMIANASGETFDRITFNIN